MSSADAFDQWFRGSQVTSKDGSPLTVFHGTSATVFDTFDIGRTSTNHCSFGKYEVKRLGSFFAEDATFARSFMPEGEGRLLKANLRILQPLDLTEGFPDAIWTGMQHLLHDMNLQDTSPDDMWELFDTGFPGGQEFVSAIRNAGYDGVVMQERDRASEAQRVWVAFESSQIKLRSGNDELRTVSNARQAMQWLESQPNLRKDGRAAP